MGGCYISKFFFYFLTICELVSWFTSGLKLLCNWIDINANALSSGKTKIFHVIRIKKELCLTLYQLDKEVERRSLTEYARFIDIPMIWERVSPILEIQISNKVLQRKPCSCVRCVTRTIWSFKIKPPWQIKLTIQISSEHFKRIFNLSVWS